MKDIIEIIKENKKADEVALTKQNEWTKLHCSFCNESFKVKRSQDDIITCPYCGDYVEG